MKKTNPTNGLYRYLSIAELNTLHKEHNVRFDVNGNMYQDVVLTS